MQQQLFDLRKCSKCQVLKPTTNFSRHKSRPDGLNVQCKTCVAEYQRKYYARNKVEVIERSRDWRFQNRDQFNANARRRRNERKQQVNAYQRDWGKRHPEKARNAHNRRRQRQAEAGFFEISNKDLRRLYSSPCVACGSSKDICLDHIIPLVKGGHYSIGNAQPLCRSCNASKGTMLLVEWKHRRTKI